MPELPSLFAIKAFVLASQYQSFTKTAEALYLTQGAVSRQIKQLEILLGVQLFIRDHHTLRLTSDGRRLLPCFQQALEKVEEGITTLRGHSAHTAHLWLNIAPTFSTRWLVPRLGDFFTTHPGIKLTVTTDYAPDERFHSRADCQVRFGTDPLDLAASQLLFKEENVLVGLPHLREAARTLPEFLNTHTCLHILGGYNRLEVWEQWVAAAKLSVEIDPSKGLAFSTMDQVINAVLAGVGVALLDRHMIRPELENGSLAVLNPVVSHGPYGYWVDSRPNPDKERELKLFSLWMLRAAQHDPPPVEPT